jgi:hypothetical protein
MTHVIAFGDMDIKINLAFQPKASGPKTLIWYVLLPMGNISKMFHSLIALPESLHCLYNYFSRAVVI